MKFQKIFFLVFFLVVWNCSLKAVSVGSNRAASRQKRTFFRASDTDNELYGFAVFEKGFTLEDNLTDCSFDAFFPISGDIVLNGGTLYMLRDMKVEKPFSIGSGKIDGNGFTIGFPDYVTGIELPTEHHDSIFEFIEQEVMGQLVTSIDWSHDDKYIAVTSRRGINELKIYYVQDEVMTLTYSQDFGSEDLRAIKWHPSDYYFALGKTNSDHIKTYYFNVASGTLEEKDSFDAFTVNGVSWSPSGDHLAVSDNLGSSLLVFGVTNGMFSSFHMGALGATRVAQSNSLSWNSTGDHVAIGLETGVGKIEVKVFEFDGDTLEENGYGDVGGHAYSVGWIPGTNYLAAGLSGSSERLLIFEHDSDAGTLTEKSSAYVGVGQKVYALECNDAGSLIAIGKAKSGDAHELELYAFDNSDVTLSLCTGCEFTAHIKVVAWSNDGNYVVTGDSAGVLKLFKLKPEPLTFCDTKLFFKSDVMFCGPVTFEGNCLINGGGNVCTFANNGSITVASGGSLLIEDAILRGIQSGDISCADNSATITLRDLSWVQGGSYSFSVGGLEIKNDVLMSGEHIFAYQSERPFSILASSNLEFDMEFTFSYDPIVVASKNLFVFADDSSRLFLNGATLHATATGLELSKGKLLVKDYANLSSEIQDLGEEVFVDEGITLGDGVNDMGCKLYPGAKLNLTSGSLIYNNLLPSSWEMLNSLATLHLLNDSQLILQESLDLGVGVVQVGPQAYITEASGKSLQGTRFMVE